MLIRNIVVFFLFCFFAVSVSAEPKLAVHLERSAIYEGETFIYRLVLTDSEPLNDDVPPDTSCWTDFNVRFLGKHRGQRGGSSLTMIFNGQTIRDEQSAGTYWTQFTYELTPKRAGDLAIPLPKIAVKGTELRPETFAVDEGGKKISAENAIAVRVIKPEEQDLVFIAIEANKYRLYPLQPLEITLVIQIKGLLARYADANPLLLIRQPPQLRIPWIEDSGRGIQPTQPLEDWLGSVLVRSPQRGFAINDFAGNKIGFDNDFFSMPFSAGDMFQKVPLQFSPVPRQIIRPDAEGKETAYWEYRFTQTFIPQEIGDHSFGPVTLKGTLPAVADAANPEGLVPQQIYAVAPPIAVSVADVPQDNRPANYIGAFGSFRWEASVTPQQAKVGDPITLTLSLLGQGSTANVRPLNLSTIPEIAEQFRVHMPPTEEIDAQSCTFTYTIRPLKAGKISLPPIAVSVFDVNTEEFTPLQSLPIPLEIAEAETVQSATVFGNVHEEDVQLSAEGFFANKTTLSEMFPPLGFAQWGVAISLLAGSYVVMALGLFVLRHRQANPHQQRRRKAWGRAKLRLDDISSALRKQNSVNLAEISGVLQGVFWGYIADRFGGTEQGMTTNDACQRLLVSGVPEPLIAAIRSLLESLDAVKYGGLDIQSLNEWTHTSLTLLQQLERISHAGRVKL